MTLTERQPLNPEMVEIQDEEIQMVVKEDEVEAKQELETKIPKEMIQQFIEEGFKTLQSGSDQLLNELLGRLGIKLTKDKHLKVLRRNHSDEIKIRMEYSDPLDDDGQREVANIHISKDRVGILYLQETNNTVLRVIQSNEEKTKEVADLYLLQLGLGENKDHIKEA